MSELIKEGDCGSCQVCKTPTESKCSACRVVYYCCIEHQKEHWKEHKVMCKPYEVCCSQEGKYMRASRDLDPGEVIFSEHPLLCGPATHLITKGSFPCVGCYRLIENKEVSKECEGCKWPCCQPDCPGLKDPRHHGLECNLLKQAAIRGVRTFYQYFRFDVLIALRALFLQKTDNDKWNNLLCFEDHLHERAQGTETYEAINEKVKFLEENILKPVPKQTNGDERQLPQPPLFTSELIHKIYGIVETQGVQCPSNSAMVLLYPTANNLEQNCLPNTTQTIEEDDCYRISVRASLPIMKEEHLTTTFCNLLLATHSRRRELRKRYITCSCTRCRDATELDSFLNALCCVGNDIRRPCGGVQLPIKPLELNTKWLCNKCKIKLPNKDIQKFVYHLGKEVEKVLSNKPCVKELEDLIAKLTNFLYPNHFLIFEVKYRLLQLHDVHTDASSKFQSDPATEKINLANELIDIVKKIDPGYSRLSISYATLVKELCNGKIAILKKHFSPDVKENIANDSKEIRNLLEEAKRILQFDMKTKLGFKLYDDICDNDKQFKIWLAENQLE